MSEMVPDGDPVSGSTTHSTDQDDLVTVCAWSNTVRYEGEWLRFEEYLSRRFGLTATHGISPRALARLDAESLETGVPAEQHASALHDPRRLAALRRTGLLDSPPSEGFDRVTRLGALALNVPATFISLVDGHRDFYLSSSGFGEPLATRRELTGQTFCHFTIEGETPLIIPDTRADALYRQVPTVESLGVAAYLGVPLTLMTGEVIGAFCAIDQSPRNWTASEIACAEDLASVVITEIELRAAITSFYTAG